MRVRSGGGVVLFAVLFAVGGEAANEVAGGSTGGSRADAAAADSVSDLPLHVVPALGAASGRLAIVLTGDGGWAAIDKQLADSLAAHGTSVVALDSRSYFSTSRDAEGASRDLARIARHYLAALGDDRLVLVGYSRGADLLPFMASRLAADLLDRVQLIALLGPAPNANFKFHLIDLLSNKHRADDRMTVPEIEKLEGKQILCFYGADEKESACPALDPAKVTVVRMPGGHHFGKEYGVIGGRIVQALAQ